MRQAQDTKVLDNAARSQIQLATAPNSAPRVTIAAVQREQLTTYAGVTPLAKIVEDSVRPDGALEAMLCDQLTAVHNAGMRLLARASVTPEVEPMVKLTVAAARMMASFHEGLLVLHRVQNGGEQATVVQHVSICDGGQAIVAGNLKQGQPDASKK